MKAAEEIFGLGRLFPPQLSNFVTVLVQVVSVSVLHTKTAKQSESKITFQKKCTTDASESYGRCIGTESQSRSLLNWLCLWKKLFVELHPDVEKIQTHRYAHISLMQCRRVQTGRDCSVFYHPFCYTPQDSCLEDLPWAGKTSPSALPTWAVGSGAALPGSGKEELWWGTIWAPNCPPGAEDARWGAACRGCFFSCTSYFEAPKKIQRLPLLKPVF